MKELLGGFESNNTRKQWPISKHGIGCCSDQYKHNHHYEHFG